MNHELLDNNILDWEDTCLICHDRLDQDGICLNGCFEDDYLDDVIPGRDYTDDCINEWDDE
jgi:hypothetical protein